MRTIDVRKENDVSTKDTVQVIFGEKDEYLLHHGNNPYFSVFDDEDEVLIYVDDIPKMIDALSALHAFIQQENH
jgi:hypothetical protein